MWPFRRQTPSYELGEDVPSVIIALKTRKHWKNLPAAVFQRFTDNAKYAFDDPGAAAGALRWLTFTLELTTFRGRLQEIASAESWSDELSTLSSNLYSFALAYEKPVASARNDSEYVAALLIVVRALASSIVCDRYALWSYTTLARLSVTYFKDAEQAASWCHRYWRAERDLVSEDESNLTNYDRAVRELLDPEKARQTAEEMRRVLPKQLLDKYFPDFDSADCLTPRDMVEQIENLILEEMCHDVHV